MADSRSTPWPIGKQGLELRPLQAGSSDSPVRARQGVKAPPHLRLRKCFLPAIPLTSWGRPGASGLWGLHSPRSQGPLGPGVTSTLAPGLL